MFHIHKYGKWEDYTAVYDKYWRDGGERKYLGEYKVFYQLKVCSVCGLKKLREII